MRKSALLKCSIFIVLLAMFASMSFACATPPPHYNYAVTSNYHGVNVPLGQTVVVTATTDDPTVTSVVFIWKNAAKIEQWRVEVTVVSGEAQSSGEPNSIGDWGVQALFRDGTGQTIQYVTNVVAIRATSFNVVPEVPILGTAGITFALVAALGVHVKRKNSK
jgi:hypothetical protein